MRTLTRPLLVSLSLALACASANAAWVSGQHGEREYKLPVPQTKPERAAPLVVMLHGCTQNADTFAESTRMNAVADEAGFLVLYPIQKISANPTRCWNWFQEKNQVRGGGEPAEIVGMVNQVAAQYPVDRKRVYVAGLSAGASMSATLAACYPDVFAAAAIHDGTMYKAASSLLEAQKVMTTGEAPDPVQMGTQAWACGGKRPLVVPVMVWHGQGDNIVNRKNADHTVRQFVTLNDLADDRKQNASVKEQPASRREEQGEKKYAYTVTTFGASDKPLVEYYKVDKLGHAWSGGKDDLLFSDAKGPDASAMMWSFFSRFNR
jgi:poly(hydroxyalkanoate) depolymerase family esterase